MYQDMKVLDVHGHVSMPPSAQAWLAMLLGANSALPSPLETGADIRNPAQLESPEDEYSRAVDRHVAYIDERAIDVQLIGPRPFLMLGWMPSHLLESATRFVNDVIHRQCRQYPSRFVGAGQLPQRADAPDASHCLPELERCVQTLGFGAVYVSPDPEGRRTSPGLHEPYWYPLYKRCQELDVPILVHGSNCLDPRFSAIPHNYQLGFVVEQYLATQFLSRTDVFERYPTLRVIVCHCGGALDRFIATDPHLSQRDLSENLFFDTCAHDVAYLEAVIKQRTVRRLVFGTEAPGSGSAIRPDTGRTVDDLVPVLRSLDVLSDDDRAAILNRNPARVVPLLGKL
jgi:predicted TIM-barrel fold metal-dependent hydrolase